MKYWLNILLLSFFSLACSQKTPDISKTKFSKEALSQKLENTEGKNETIQQILNKHKGRVVVIDFWAGWCRDCLNAMPKAMELHEKNPDVDFVYFSLDRSRDKFLQSLERFNMKNKENYWFSEGWKNNFNNYIDLNWIPRYIVINQKSEIAKYYSVSPDDPELQAAIDRLTK